jgi:hypothetical protein
MSEQIAAMTIKYQNKSLAPKYRFFVRIMEMLNVT